LIKNNISGWINTSYYCPICGTKEIVQKLNLSVCLQCEKVFEGIFGASRIDQTAMRAIKYKFR